MNLVKQNNEPTRIKNEAKFLEEKSYENTQ